MFLLLMYTEISKLFGSYIIIRKRNRTCAVILDIAQFLTWNTEVIRRKKIVSKNDGIIQNKIDQR